MKINRIMSLWKILTDLFVIRQKRIKNTFADIVYNVFVVKKSKKFV